jgi:hypothetical protein
MQQKLEIPHIQTEVIKNVSLYLQVTKSRDCLNWLKVQTTIINEIKGFGFPVYEEYELTRFFDSFHLNNQTKHCFVLPNVLIKLIMDFPLGRFSN